MARKAKGGKRPVEQYNHDQQTRLNNPPVGLVTPETDRETGSPKTYAYDPHLDPALHWAGKAEHLSFEVPTVSLHVHERIDPRAIIEAVRKKNGGSYEQLSLFSLLKENPPLREAVEFYQHAHNWSNRLIAGDSLVVMNSLLEKEGLSGKVQMVYLDPPYGIKYGSNFQPFVNKRDVKDGKDEDLTQEPEMIKAFRDTWELGIHSYLTYLRDRLMLAKELLTESGSCFVQISDENVHLVKNLMDEVFGTANFISIIAFATTSGFESGALPRAGDYVVWYAKEHAKLKYRRLFVPADRIIGEDGYRCIKLRDGTTRSLTVEEIRGEVVMPDGARLYKPDNIISQGGASEPQPFNYAGKTYEPPANSHWKAHYPQGMERLASVGRLHVSKNSIQYIRFAADFPWHDLNNVWTDTITGQFTDPKTYVVQTNTKVVGRCVLMTTDPGDLVLDPTCGSGTTAFVAEQWGRRWITCDTSRVALTLAKQRLMTAVFDYYQLAHPEEGVGSGFIYKTVPHITLGSIANNEPAPEETLYDQPYPDNKKTRVSGPFTVEAVPAPAVKPLEEIESELPADTSIARSGETLRQDEWRGELLKAGIRGKGGQSIEFARVEPLAGTRWLQADAETKVASEKKVASGQGPVDSEEKLITNHYPLTTAQRVVISFGPEHAPLEQRQVALALEEANQLMPRPKIIVFAAFQFDPEAAKDIDETNWPGVLLLKAQMNADLLTEDLKKKRSSNESFWLIGQPDVRVISEEWLVDSQGRKVMPYDIGKELSGFDGLAEINRVGGGDLSLYAAISERRDLWADLADAQGGGLDSDEHRRGASAKQHRGISPVSGDCAGIVGGIGDTTAFVAAIKAIGRNRIGEIVGKLRRNQQIIERAAQIAVHSPLTTKHFFQVQVQGFDYYNVKTGTIDSGGTEKIALWLLDTDYDGRSLFPRQVFFPMAGEKDGWSRLARNLKAEIDEELIEAYRGTVSLPFEMGKNRRVAVKIVDDRGIESLKIMEI